MKKEYFSKSKVNPNAESLKARSPFNVSLSLELDNIERASMDEPMLKELVDAITNENIHDEFDWGSTGREGAV